MSHDSDPLPYSQVDRAVKPRAALLAGLMGVTNQHAVGALVEFWDLCGDPRELERIVEETQVGREPEVVLSTQEATRRFALASGKTVAVEDLASLGFLEVVSTGVRVRGMSRYFKVITARITARNKGKAGGAASVEARRKKHGTAQPSRSGPRSESGSTSASGQLRGGFGDPSGSAQAEVEPGSKPPEPADSGQRTAVNVSLETLSVETDPPAVEKRQHPLQAVWNAHKAPQQPAWKETSPARKKRADARWNEREDWPEVVRRIAASTFCRGENPRGWIAGPDFLLKPDTAVKALEGAYDGRRQGGPDLSAFDDVPEGGREVEL